MRKLSMKRKSKSDLASTAASSSEDVENNEENGQDSSQENNNLSKKKGSKKGKKEKKSSNVESSNGTEDQSEDEQYEVQTVLDQRTVKGIKQFLIRWKGYGSDSDTWEPESTLNCPDLIEKFLNSQKTPAKGKKRSSTKGSKSAKKSKASDSEDEDDPEPETSKKSPKKSKRGDDETQDSEADDDEEPEEKPKKSSKSKKSKHSDSEEDYEAEPGKSPKKSSKSPKKSKRGDDENEIVGEYEVDRIIEVHHKKNGQREFLVHWKGYSTNENTWEPEENMSCQDLIERFMSKVNRARAAEARELRVNRKPTKHFTLSMAQNGRRLSRRNQGKQRAQYKETE